MASLFLFFIAILTLSAKSFGSSEINFSFQNARKQSSLIITLVKNISMYHPKSRSFEHVKFIKTSDDLSCNEVGLPINV